MKVHHLTFVEEKEQTPKRTRAAAQRPCPDCALNGPYPRGAVILQRAAAKRVLSRHDGASVCWRCELARDVNACIEAEVRLRADLLPATAKILDVAPEEMARAFSEARKLVGESLS